MLRTDGPTGEPARHQRTKPDTPVCATRPTEVRASGGSPGNQSSSSSIRARARDEIVALAHSRARRESSDNAAGARTSRLMGQR